MAKFSPYTGPERFTSFGLGGDGRTFVSLEESARPEVQEWLTRFPRLFNRALRSLGYHIRGDMQTALRMGGLPGQRWKELSLMHRYRRMELLKSGQVKPDAERWSNSRNFSLKKRVGNVRQRGKENLFARWKSGGRGKVRNPNAMGGRLVNAPRYRMTRQLSLEIGALNASAAKYLKAVQGGNRGTRGRFQFNGSQPITPAMRRALWAAGVPIRKGKTRMEQPKRPLVYPLFQREKRNFAPFVLEKIAGYLEKEAAKR